MLIHEPTMEFRDWTSDSRRWAEIDVHPGDIVVATAPKCGTTWTQRIVGMLLTQSAAPVPVQNVQPWIDGRFWPIEVVKATLEAQPGRRGLKTHSPLGAIPYHDDLYYIHVARDPRDACLSWHNHSTGYSAAARERLDGHGLGDESIGARWPVPPTDQRAFFRAFMGSGEHGPTTEFDIDGYCELERSYWAARHRPNVLLVHYNDLKADLEGEMRRIAAFAQIDTPESLWPELVAAADFAAMKRDADALLPHAAMVWQNGAQQFLHKGTNQRWRDVTTADDHALYEAAVSVGMSPSLRAWAEGGRRVAGEPTVLPD